MTKTSKNSGTTKPQPKSSLTECTEQHSRNQTII